MKLNFSYLRTGGDLVDLAATVDATVTVGDLANAIHRCDPVRQAQGERAPRIGEGSSLSLRVHSSGAGGPSTVLSEGLPLAASGIRSGSTLSLAPVTARWQGPGAQGGAAAATLTVLSGPDAGKTFALREGTSFLGRETGCEVKLSDPLVSKKHARITISDIAEVVDLGSANGLMIGGTLVPRAVLRPQDRVIVGDTSLGITVHRSTAAALAATTDVDFNRSPRLDPTFKGRTFEAPEAPDSQRPIRFPVLAMISPLIMGAVLFAFTRNPLSIIFVALSPLLMVGTFVDNKVQNRRAATAAQIAFDEAVMAMRAELQIALFQEQAGRLLEAPSTADALDAVNRQTNLLWTRRPEHERFLCVRLGTGTQASRHTVELPRRNRAQPRHWAALAALQDDSSQVTAVPVIGDLRKCGSVGIAGARADAVGVARGVVLQAIALHSPADLAVAALTSSDSAKDWEWLKWLPHNGSPHSPLTGGHLAAEAASGTRLIAEIEELIGGRDKDSAAPALLVLVEDDAPVDRSRLVGIAENGPVSGVHVVWVSTAQERLPAACRTFVTVDPSSGQVTAGFVRDAVGVRPVVCETVTREAAMTAAKALAPVADAGARVIDDSDLPRSVSFLSLLGPELAADPSAVVDKWRESESIVDRQGPAVKRRNTSLRALVGQAAGEPLTLDLRTQGPHALVGGTTGAGKSEFLQSWVLGMAAAYSPDTLTFLFVDYKGGAAFADCIQLPHSVGMVTDLSPHLVRRALTSLNAELKYREHILNAKKAKDLLELQRRGDPESPPSLVIVVDEFAALVQEVPEFVDGVVNVAQRGRSLGLHLILATQRPAGVIKDNLRANTNLRVALRMADEADSTDVLGSDVAAAFSPDIPGRGAAKTGPGRITGFQTGYAGGWTSDEAPPAQLFLHELTFGPGRRWEEPEIEAATPTRDLGPNDISRLVSSIAVASGRAEIVPPRKPWLPEMASTYDLQFLGQRRDSELVIGVVDDPAKQQQRSVFFYPDVDGNMAVYGTGGSGKSTALRTLAIAAGITPRSGPCHVYGMDFGSSGLRMLESLPHVGSILSGDDSERIIRLIKTIREIVDERSERFAAVRAGTITEYRDITGRRDEPRILVLVDGLSTFRNEYEFSGRMAHFTSFTQIAADGRPVGVHVVVTADRPSTVPSALGSSIQRRLVLRLADENDYLMLDTPSDVLGSLSPSGRGVLEQLDVQVAVLGGSANVAEQAKAIDRLAVTLRQLGNAPAPTIKRLPDLLHAGELVGSIGDRVVIGMADDDLGPVAVEPAGFFLIAGPPGSGRTSTLAAISSAVSRERPAARRYYLGNKRSPLPTALEWTKTARTPEEVAELAAALVQDLPTASFCQIVVEGLTDFLSGPADMNLQELAKVVKTTEHMLIADAETSTLSQSWPLVQAVRSARRGFALQPDQMEGDSIFRTSFPRISRAEFPPGRGLLVEGGKTRRVQIALPD